MGLLLQQQQQQQQQQTWSCRGETYLLSGYTGQRRSARHFTTAIIAGRRLPQRHATGPSPRSDHRDLFLRAGNPTRCFPRRVVAVKAEPQQGARNPRKAGKERSEQCGQTAQTCERNKPHNAGKNQYENTVFEF